MKRELKKMQAGLCMLVPGALMRAPSIFMDHVHFIAAVMRCDFRACLTTRDRSHHQLAETARMYTM